MLKIRPCGHRVLVRLKTIDDKEKVSAGGIILYEPNQAHKEARQRSMQEAYVVELGQTAFKDFGDGHAWCEVGELVKIARHSGEDTIDEETGDIYRIINDQDIFAVLEGEE